MEQSYAGGINNTRRRMVAGEKREKVSLLGLICTKEATARSKGDSPLLSSVVLFSFFYVKIRIGYLSLHQTGPIPIPSSRIKALRRERCDN